MELLLQSVPEIVIANSAVLLILLVLLFRLQSSRGEQKLIEDNAQQAELIKQLINENQRNLDDKISRSQAQLFEMILADREKQLKTLEDLKLTLEKRFANSESALSSNIQSFKVDMVERFEQLKRSTAQSLQAGQEQLTTTVGRFGEKITESMQAHQASTTQLISENIRKGIHDLRQDLDRSLIKQTEVTSKSIASLTESTDNRLKEISGQVEKRLTDGFEKTNQTFNDVIKRLALIEV